MWHARAVVTRWRPGWRGTRPSAPRVEVLAAAHLVTAEVRRRAHPAPWSHRFLVAGAMAQHEAHAESFEEAFEEGVTRRACRCQAIAILIVGQGDDGQGLR